MIKTKIKISGLVILAMAGFYSFGRQNTPFSDFKVEVIKDPHPTHRAEIIRPLRVVKILGPDIDSDRFLANIGKIQVDKDGNFFVYDSVLFKIFKFNRYFKLVRIFGQTGQGPGEYRAVRFVNLDFRVFGDGGLYLLDQMGFKVIQYDLNGQWIMDWKYPKRAVVLPLRINGGQWLSYTPYTVDVINEELSYRERRLLTVRDFNKIIISGIPRSDFLHMSNLLVDVFDGSTYGMIYPTAGCFYLFEGCEVVRRFFIIPERWTEGLKAVSQGFDRDQTNSGWQKGGKGARYYSSAVWRDFIQEFFVDSDRSMTFYVSGGATSGRLDNPLYRFDTSGQLLSAWGYPRDGKDGNRIYLTYHCKGKGLIFASHSDKIYVLEEE